MRRIEIEEYHGGYVIREFQDTCEKCHEKHWVLRKTEELHGFSYGIREAVKKRIGEWLD